MRLKGHEKFVLREGWITKGIRGIEADPTVFSGSNGPDVLGVGSNMVKSIKYWMQAFGLLDDKKNNELSKLGQIIANNDIYLEDYFSLWLMHSMIAKNADKATIWYLFFNKCQVDEFRKDELFELLKKELLIFADGKAFKDNAVKDDIDVLLNMYSKEKAEDDPEDKNLSPLAILGLIHKGKDLYVRQQPDLRKIDDHVLLYELALIFENSGSVSIDDISELAKNIYHLNKVTVNGMLDRLANRGYIQVNRTAGLDVIYRERNMTSNEVIDEYYKLTGDK